MGLRARILTICLALSGAAQAEEIRIETRDNRVIYDVRVADDPAERQRGLMQVSALPEDSGMIFLFPKPARAAFWMKDTLIPLDMIFIDPDSRVFAIHANAKPHDLTPISPRGAALGVLELAGGEAARAGIMPGDVVFLDGKPLQPAAQ